MRDYQIRGLNWMISLYEHGINGILADEMVIYFCLSNGYNTGEREFGCYKTHWMSNFNSRELFINPGFLNIIIICTDLCLIIYWSKQLLLKNAKVTKTRRIRQEIHLEPGAWTLNYFHLVKIFVIFSSYCRAWVKHSKLSHYLDTWNIIETFHPLILLLCRSPHCPTGWMKLNAGFPLSELCASSEIKRLGYVIEVFVIQPCFIGFCSDKKLLHNSIPLTMALEWYCFWVSNLI